MTHTAGGRLCGVARLLPSPCPNRRNALAGRPHLLGLA